MVGYVGVVGELADILAPSMGITGCLLLMEMLLNLEIFMRNIRPLEAYFMPVLLETAGVTSIS